MGFFTWVLLGLIVGIIAKLLMPGKDPGGLIVTILLGVAGAFVGGYLGSFVGLNPVSGVNLMSIVTATLGAIVLLILYRVIRR